MALNKQRVYEYLQTKQGKKKLYNYVARFLLQKLDLSRAGAAVTLVVDKCKNKDEIADFNEYVSNQLEALLPLAVPLNIHHERSQETPVFRPWICSAGESIANTNTAIASGTTCFARGSRSKPSICRGNKKADPITPIFPRL